MSLKTKSEKEKEKEVSITAGVLDDCQELLRRFSAKPTVRYQDFATVWQEMDFCSIFCGRPSFRELYEFVEELFQIAKAFMFPPYPYRTRIGAIYMMYGLYFKQPFNDRLVPIKVDLDEWKQIQAFVEVLVKDEHFDTFFIFRTLVEKNAFSYEASSIQYGFDRYTREKLAHIKQPQKFDPMKYGLSLFDEIDFSEEWSKFENLYHKMKADSEDFSTSHSFIPRNWPVEVLHAVASASTSSAPTVSRRSNSQLSDDDSEQLSIGHRRKLLKSRTVATKKKLVSPNKAKKGKLMKGRSRSLLLGKQKKRLPILNDGEFSDTEPEGEKILLPELDASKEC